MSRSYKYVPQSSTVSAVSDAFSELTTLGEECREIVDNAPEGLNQTQRIQTLDETASELENLSEPDIPGDAGDLPISYSEAVPARKRMNTGRAVRRDNAVAILSRAVSALEDRIEQMREDADKLGADADDAEAELPDGTEPTPVEGEPTPVEMAVLKAPPADEASPADKAEKLRNDADEMETCKDDIQQVIDAVEGLEFPGMFG